MTTLVRRFWESLWEAISPESEDERLRELKSATERVVPVIWLLGKTGAGKSSIIRCVTGASGIEVGNGYKPCTRTADIYEFPTDQPVLKFLDTRGLGETEYDPADDISECMRQSHVVVAVARLDDPTQHELCDILRTVRRRSRTTEILLVHTGRKAIPDGDQRARARYHAREMVRKAVGREVPSIEFEWPDLQKVGQENQEERDNLVNALCDLLPGVALFLAKSERSSDEGKEFAHHRGAVIWYAAAAGASDVLPVVGLGSVIAIQGSMLTTLARRYHTEWTWPLLLRLKACLGTGFLIRYGAGFALRQVGKLVPVYGQTVGAFAAGTTSFATTYAMGRVAAYFLFQVRQGRDVSPGELRSLYKQAFQSGKNSGNAQR